MSTLLTNEVEKTVVAYQNRFWPQPLWKSCPKLLQLIVNYMLRSDAVHMQQRVHVPRYYNVSYYSSVILLHTDVLMYCLFCSLHCYLYISTISNILKNIICININRD